MTSQILIGATNTIKEDIIKQTMDKELKAIEKSYYYQIKTTN